jgi:hypothetical protein
MSAIPKHVNLPDDEWADLRHPRKVPERLRRQVTMASAALGLDVDLKAVGDAENDDEALKLLGIGGLEQSNDVNDLGVVAFVEAWSFDAPITIDSVRDLPADVYDALRTIVAPLIPLMHVNAEPSPEAGSPTEPSQP